ncbi:MAG: hypothetical protein V4726_22210 [Verrucomicrobiota bacterium]
MKLSSSGPSKSPSLCPLIWMAIACFGIPIAGWSYFDWNVATWIPENEKRGQYGDQFGALNTLFSGLAAAGVIFTLYVNFRQLQLQQQNFNSQTESLQRGQEQLAEQTRIIARELTHSPSLHPMIEAEDASDRADKVFELACVEIRHQINHEEANGGRGAEMHTALEAFVMQAQNYLKAVSQIQYSIAPHAGSTRRTALAIRVEAEEKERIAGQLNEWAQTMKENREVKQD